MHHQVVHIRHLDGKDRWQGELEAIVMDQAKQGSLPVPFSDWTRMVDEVWAAWAANLRDSFI